MVGSPDTSSYSTHVLQWKQAGRMWLRRHGLSCLYGAQQPDATHRRLRLKLLRVLERRVKAGVDRYLIAGDELVRFVGHPNHLLQFLEHRGRHALAERGGGVGSDA